MLRTLSAVLAVFAVGSLSVAQAAPTTGTVTLASGEKLIFSCDEIRGLGTSEIVVVGRPAHANITGTVKIADKDYDTEKNMCAAKIVVVLSDKSEAKTASGIKSADLTGSPQVVYKGPDKDGNPTTTTASGKHAIYNGKDQTISLQGNVKIVSDNPALFQGPAEMTGDDAWISLGKVGPYDVRFRISSSPGVSSIVATPKSREETKPNK
jgi:lipopolysaccharide export system protein LptA